MKKVTFKVYKKDSSEEFIFDISLDRRLIDIKKEILSKLYNDEIPNQYNYLDLDNITERVYKDFGKQYFEKGIIPNTLDNFKLEQITNDGRIFVFNALPKNINIIQIEKKINETGFLKENIKKQLKNKNTFIYDDDFPPLCSTKN